MATKTPKSSKQIEHCLCYVEPELLAYCLIVDSEHESEWSLSGERRDLLILDVAICYQAVQDALYVLGGQNTELGYVSLCKEALAAEHAHHSVVMGSNCTMNDLV